MTPAELLRLQKTKWMQMQQGFAATDSKRRPALEEIKLVPVDESLPDAMAAIVAGLGKVGTSGFGKGDQRGTKLIGPGLKTQLPSSQKV